MIGRRADHEAAPRGTRGFTLVEILIAVTLFAIVSTAIAGLIMHAAAMVGEARRMQKALALAEEKLERLKSIGYGTLSDLGTTSWYHIETFREPGPTETGTGTEHNVIRAAQCENADSMYLVEPREDPDSCSLWADTTPEYEAYERVTHVRRNVPTTSMIEIRVMVLWKRPGRGAATNTGNDYDPAAETFGTGGDRPIVELRTYLSRTTT